MFDKVNAPTLTEIHARSDTILLRIKDLFENKNNPALTFHALQSLGNIAAETLKDIP